MAPKQSMINQSPLFPEAQSKISIDHWEVYSTHFTWIKSPKT